VLPTVALAVYLAYRGDIAAARQRVASDRRVIETGSGPIQYADVGRGDPVLVIHGAGGGYDQGLLLARWYFGDEYRVIAPSRFGYLQTPLPADASPAAQADAHARLLDALGVDWVQVVGASAGALSSMQLAIRHPERVSSLVLVVPAAWAPPTKRATATTEVAPSGFVTKVILKSDFAIWAFMNIARDAMLSFLGVPTALQATITPDQHARLTQLMGTILPVSQRQEGIANDAANHKALTRYALEEIRAPTLVIDAADVGTFPGAKYTAEHIPGARFIPYETGGHVLLGHEVETRAAITDFLRQQRVPVISR
jgi:pimeloyl-ACP methyl ester carboxylesterase